MYYLTMTSSFRGTNRLTGTLKGFERNLTKYSQIFLSPPTACCMGGETQGLLGSFPILHNTSHHCGSISFFFFFSDARLFDSLLASIHTDKPLSLLTYFQISRHKEKRFNESFL